MNLRTARRKLQRAFTVKRRVVVSVGECEDGNAAETWMDGETIRVCIDAELSEPSRVHMLAHEWGHVRLSDNAGRICTRHSIAWAREYAAIYDHLFGNG